MTWVNRARRALANWIRPKTEIERFAIPFRTHSAYTDAPVTLRSLNGEVVDVKPVVFPYKDDDAA
jgi:hypothetical protein